jgi:hypothetical protein
VLCVLAAVGCLPAGGSAGDGGSRESSDDAASPPPPESSRFRDLNGVMWIYTTANDVRFADIEADLDTWKARGIRTLGIYSPYWGEKDQWLGAAPRDFYAVPPQNGTLDDFRSLVAGAHQRDMKVIAFMGFHSIDERSELFTTAERQYETGDRTSHEVASFLWSEDPEAPTPTPIPDGPSEWKRSEVSGAYYWALWDNAGLDVNHPEAAIEIEKAITFWMDTGLDGLMLDSGVVHPDFERLWVEVPRQRGRDLWITFESTWSEDEVDFDDFGLTSWFAFEDNDYANTYTLVTFPEEDEAAIDADGLEEELAHVDWARERGKLTHAWSLLERAFPEPRMRVQEAALLAGAGVMYGAPVEDDYAGWPTDIRTDWERVLVTVNDNRALLPSASRARVPAGPSPRAYAMRRTADDGSQTALLVYNFEAQAQTITLDLAGSGIATGQVPIDLYGGLEPPPIDGETYSFELPGYGFALLGVTPRGGG